MIPNAQFLAEAWPTILLALALGYCVGATPAGLLLSKRLGLGDIRRIGSGNIGTMNVLRTGHKGAAAATLALDALKGFLPAYLGFLYAGYETAAAAGLGAFLGHCFSIWLNFFGGKGVATGFGVFLALRWEIGLIAAVVWLGVAAVGRIASVASLAAVGAGLALFPVFELWETLPAILLMALIAVWRHVGNLRRLLRGEEPRITLGGGGGAKRP